MKSRNMTMPVSGSTRAIVDQRILDQRPKMDGMLTLDNPSLVSFHHKTGSIDMNLDLVSD